MTQIAFIGGGNMARSLIGGLLKHGTAPGDISVAEPMTTAREALTRDLGVTCHADNSAAVAGAEVVVLAVKPQVMPAIQAELRSTLEDKSPLLISIAAGVRIDQLERWFGALPIVRCMPNTPALIGAGATGLCANAAVSAAQKAKAQEVLGTAGVTRWIDDETLMDTVTALSGSGPAYFFALVEGDFTQLVGSGAETDGGDGLPALFEGLVESRDAELIGDQLGATHRGQRGTGAGGDLGQLEAVLFDVFDGVLAHRGGRTRWRPRRRRRSLRRW